MPSAKAQEDLIRLTYKNAGLDYFETGYFESHGTGKTVIVQSNIIRTIFQVAIACQLSKKVSRCEELLKEHISMILSVSTSSIMKSIFRKKAYSFTTIHFKIEDGLV